ncbi:MAG TPA: ABC transporter permease subunit [Solirubrobacteraceae bacterium]|nr:ABC transporter permease subunit [Solirubrobacteraceae bacterium]
MAASGIAATPPGSPPSSPPGPASPPPGLRVIAPPRQGTRSWPLIDRLGYWACWAAGISLCAIAIAIVVYMFVQGLSALSLHLLVTSPAATLQQSQSGGFLDPLEGTFVITAVGIAIAAPLGVAIAVWLSEYGNDSPLARAVESAIEMIAGVPSVVLAIFGLLVFSQSFLGFLSESTSSGNATGKSFLTAGAIMALLALPLVVAATREGLAQLPGRMREASFGLGKTRATTIRHVLLPSVRSNVAEGVVLGMGRIIGDTAIIVILLGGTLKTEPAGNVPVLGLLRGTGSTLTNYVYYNSPAGEGNSHEKAYAAAFVLMIIVLVLNFAVVRIAAGRRRSDDIGGSWWRLAGGRGLIRTLRPAQEPRT